MILEKELKIRNPPLFKVVYILNCGLSDYQHPPPPLWTVAKLSPAPAPAGLKFALFPFDPPSGLVAQP